MRLTLGPGTVLRVLVGVAVALVAIHTVVLLVAYAAGRTGLGPVAGTVNLAIDSAIPTWIASAILAAAGILGFALASRADSRADRLAWIGLGILGFVLSIDEVATIHERWGEIASGTPLSLDLLGYSWVLGGLVFAGLVAVLFLPFLIRLGSHTRWLLIAAGVVFLAGAVGVEVVNGTTPLADGDGGRALLQHLLVAGLEEFLEFIGASLLVYALMVALAGPTGMVSVVVDRKEHTAP